MPARLNRRRYKEIVATLKEIISDRKQTAERRLRATETLLEVYNRHDRSESQKEQRRRAADAQTQGTQAPAEEPRTVSREDALREAQAFLARVGEKETTNNEAESD